MPTECRVGFLKQPDEEPANEADRLRLQATASGSVIERMSVAMTSTSHAGSDEAISMISSV